LELPNEAWLALAGTLFGGAGLKIVEAIVGRSGRKNDVATQFRNELRQELVALRAEMDKLRKESAAMDAVVDSWRTKYYGLLAAVVTKDQAAINAIIQERA
jgi:hypothetical protein